MSLNCPGCTASLVTRGERYCCDVCERQFLLHASCPDCGMPLEILKACGAVDYFCIHGHGLISRSRIIQGLQEIV